MANEKIVTYSLPDQAEVTGRAEMKLREAENYSITTPVMAEAAAEDLRKIKALSKELEENRKAITKPLDDEKAGIMDFYRPAQTFLGDAEGLLKRKLMNYQADQERIRREAQAKAEAEARKERERLEKQAQKAEASGKAEQAEALRENATLVSTNVVQEAPKLTGIATRTIWRGRVIDKHALVSAALSRPDIMSLIVIDESALNKLATALKDNLNIPGAEAYSDTQMSAKAA
jgi:hypothetical protein